MGIEFTGGVDVKPDIDLTQLIQVVAEFLPPRIRRRQQSRRWTLLLLSVLSGWTLVGCTPNHYRTSADEETYGVIREKAPRVPNVDSRFSIEFTNDLVLTNLPVVQTLPDFLGPEGSQELGAYRLSLEKALELSIRHNRTYQSRKEQLYLAALNLTLARYQFTPIFSGGGSARVIGETVQQVNTAVDPVTQETTSLLTDNLVEQRRVTADGHVNVSWLLRDIGRVTLAFTTDFLRFISGDPRSVTSSEVGATLTRPLLQNAGFKQQMENLTQAERDVFYALRDFSLFRKNFSVQVATAYYGVLGNRDEARNSYLNLQSSRKSAERTRALAREGRATQSDLGRLEQQELSAETAWINATRRYQQSLDDFKLTQLGIPVDVRIALDDQELEMLQIRHPSISVEEAIRVALSARLDYRNVQDRHEDALRRVAVAANFLKPQLDLLADAGFGSKPQQSGFSVPDPKRYHWSAGLDVDLPFDRKAERNAYRFALIEEKQAARDLEQQEDEIKLQVRESWRNLDQAQRNYAISKIGVELAQRRVEEQNLLAELGRARALDQVDAQNDLINSKNQLTQALVSHTIARLQFWNNMGILYIKDGGQWEEINDAPTR